MTECKESDNENNNMTIPGIDFVLFKWNTNLQYPKKVKKL